LRQQGSSRPTRTHADHTPGVSLLTLEPSSLTRDLAVREPVALDLVLGVNDRRCRAFHASRVDPQVEPAFGTDAVLGLDDVPLAARQPERLVQRGTEAGM
jgi:hypothetical protein